MAKFRCDNIQEWRASTLSSLFARYLQFTHPDSVALIGPTVSRDLRELETRLITEKTREGGRDNNCKPPKEHAKAKAKANL